MNQLMDSKNTLGTLVVTKFPMDTEQDYELDESQPWVRDILIELNENADTKLPEEYIQDSYVRVDLKIEKKFNSTYGEYLILSGSVATEYFTQCIRTLKEMKDSMEVEFKACYLDSVNEKNEELADQVDIYMDGEVRELYFYDKRIADIKLLIHEQIYLNYNQYPVLDNDADLGLNEASTATKQ